MQLSFSGPLQVYMIHSKYIIYNILCKNHGIYCTLKLSYLETFYRDTPHIILELKFKIYFYYNIKPVLSIFLLINLMFEDLQI